MKWGLVGDFFKIVERKMRGVASSIVKMGSGSGLWEAGRDVRGELWGKTKKEVGCEY